MTNETEILVHISASTTRQNDELFRALAGAYSEFEPHRIHQDRSAKRRSKRTPGTKVRHAAPATGLERIATCLKGVEAPVPSASKESFGSLPSHISSDGNRRDHGPSQDDSMRPLSRLAQLDRSYHNWRENAAPRPSFKQGQAEPQVSSDGAEDADTGFIEDSQSALLALQSQLLDTYSTTSADTSADEDQDDVDAENHGQSPHEPIQEADEPQSVAEEVLSPALGNDHDETILEISSFEDTTTLSTNAIHDPKSCSDADSVQIDFSGSPIDAFPPPPAISVASPAILPSQVTMHLATIKTTNPGRFKPLKFQRDLETDERGYWHVDCTTWPPGIQQDFWSSLYEHVCSGRLGWGTTLHRETASKHSLGLVRLYCWGEVAEHMWLLVWLCSKGKVSMVGSKWIDADGIAVIEMG